MIDISAEGEVLEACAGVLQEVFGYDAFRGPQAAIVTHVSEGGDALVLMPTGGGKSLCYQIPAIVRQREGMGVTIVVSPLIALMHDQVGALLEAGVDAAFLNSSLSSDEAQDVERRLRQGSLGIARPGGVHARLAGRDVRQHGARHLNWRQGLGRVGRDQLDGAQGVQGCCHGVPSSGGVPRPRRACSADRSECA